MLCNGVVPRETAPVTAGLVGGRVCPITGIGYCTGAVCAFSPSSGVFSKAGSQEMASPPRRPTNPMAAAEAAFKPIKKPVAPVRVSSGAPNVRELVSIRIDRAVLDYFQDEGPGWQDRINEVLRQAVLQKPGEAERSDG